MSQTHCWVLCDSMEQNRQTSAFLRVYVLLSGNKTLKKQIRGYTEG